MLSTSSGSRGGRGSGGAWQAAGKSVACVRHLKEHTCGRQRDRGGHGTEDWGLGTGYSAAYYTQKERRREQLALTEMKRNVTRKLQAAPLPPTLMLPLMQTVLLPLWKCILKKSARAFVILILWIFSSLFCHFHFMFPTCCRMPQNVQG